MGYIKHNAIIVTHWSKDLVESAHSQARKIFRQSFDGDINFSKSGASLVGDIQEGIINGQFTFLIAPDGSKEGWELSNKADVARNEFIDWINEPDNLIDYIEVRFGGDNEDETIIRSKHSYLNTDHE